jgi:hypothetical protein
MTAPTNEELMAEIVKLRQELEALRNPPRVKIEATPTHSQPTWAEREVLSKLSVPKHILDGMAATVGDDVVRDIVADSKRR